MAKLFDWNPQSGDLTDSISGQILNRNNNAYLSETEKGYALDGYLNPYSGGRSLNISDLSEMQIGLKDYSISISFKLTSNELRYLLRINKLLYIYPSGDYFRIWYVFDTYLSYRDTDAGSLKLGQWQTITITCDRNGNWKSYVDNELQDSVTVSAYSGTSISLIDFYIGANTNTLQSTIGLVGRTKLYDHVLSTKEIRRDYLEMINAKSIASAKSNFAYELQKPKDLSKETGLIAAYNMKPVNGIITDISNNNNTGTIYGNPLSTKDGMKFNGVNDNISIPYNSSLKNAVFTILAKVKLKSIPSLQSWLLAMKDAATVYGVAFQKSASNSIELFYQVSSQIILTSTLSLDDILNKEIIITLIHGATEDKIYINAKDVTGPYRQGVFESGITTTQKTLKIGSRSDDYQYADAEINYIKIYNRELSLNEIKEYNNQYAKQVNFIEDFKYAPADGTNITPKDWIKGTGSFKISELSEDDSVLSHLKKGTKVLECTITGDIIHQFNKDEYINGGYIEMDYYSGSIWIRISSVVDTAISTYSWLSHSSVLMVYTLSVGDKITNIKYIKGIDV